jgi:hypothetical protein
MPTCFSAAHVEICLQLAVLGQFEKARERLGAASRCEAVADSQIRPVLVAARTAPFLLAQALLCPRLPNNGPRSKLKLARHCAPALGTDYVISLSAHLRDMLAA